MAFDSTPNEGFWRQVRWCDRSLSKWQLRILMLAWLPQVIGEHIPWQPILPLQIHDARELTRSPFRVLEYVPGYQDAFRPTRLGEMVLWLSLLGQQPEELRPGLVVISPVEHSPAPAPHACPRASRWRRAACPAGRRWR
jgi:hypothetical protein